MRRNVWLRPLAANYQQAQGEQRYAREWLLQQRAVPNRSACGTLFLGEHASVLTLGKHGNADNVLINQEMLLRMGITVVRTDRGGDVTFHGRGQLVGYPVLDLAQLGIGAKEYVQRLLGCIATTLRAYSIEAHQDERAPGLWLPAQEGRPLRKICAIGIHIGQGICTHGFALNVNTELRAFHWINPCGFTDRGVTSLAQELGDEVPLNDVKAKFIAAFESAFGIELLHPGGRPA